MPIDVPSPPFLPADKRGWPRLLVRRMILRRMRSGLFRIHCRGLASLRSALERDPSGVLFVANHSCWWDLFLVHFLNELVPVDGYGMMEHANLKRFGFFRRIGAFSVERSSPAGVRASLAYTIDRLSRPRTGVWIFPQGKILSNDARPIVFERGLSALVRRAKRVRVCLVALRYDFWQDERPEAFVSFGEPFVADDPGSVVSDCEVGLTKLLDELRSESLPQDGSRFESVLTGKRSVSETYARFRERAVRLSASILRSRRSGESRTEIE